MFFSSILNHPTTKMKISNILRRYSDLKQASFGNIPTLTNQHSFKVSQFHKLLKNSYGKSLSKLQVSSYKKILQKYKKVLLNKFSLINFICRTCVSTIRTSIMFVSMNSFIRDKIVSISLKRFIVIECY